MPTRQRCTVLAQDGLRRACKRCGRAHRVIAGLRATLDREVPACDGQGGPLDTRLAVRACAVEPGQQMRREGLLRKLQQRKVSQRKHDRAHAAQRQTPHRVRRATSTGVAQDINVTAQGHTQRTMASPSESETVSGEPKPGEVSRLEGSPASKPSS